MPKAAEKIRLHVGGDEKHIVLSVVHGKKPRKRPLYRDSVGTGPRKRFEYFSRAAGIREVIVGQIRKRAVCLLLADEPL